MHSIVIHYPHLGRDLRHLLERVPDLGIYEGDTADDAGCVQSHQDIVSWAQMCGLDCVFVVEDDCEFTKHFDYVRWCEEAIRAQAQGYDLMIGGCAQIYDPKVVRYGLIEVNQFTTAHCIVYFESGYQKVLNATCPLDESLSRGCKCAVAYPRIAWGLSV